MLRIPPLPPFIRRRRDNNTAIAPPSVLTVADVIDVFFDGPSGSLDVQFEMPAGVSLNNPNDTGADPAKWTAVVGGTLYVGASFVFDGGNSLVILFNDLGAGAGPNVLNYAAGPSDISDTAGAALAAFENRAI